MISAAGKTIGCHREHNSVEEVSFQVSQNLPQQPLSLKQQINAGYLQSLIKRDPSCTLKQLCDWVCNERGITIGKTAMCRLVKEYGLQRKHSHRAHVYPKHPLPLAA
jgi:hypothetical protein